MITVRPANSNDLEALVALMRAFYAESGFTLDEQAAAESFRWLLNNPLFGAIWLAESPTTPVGHVVLIYRYAMEHGGMVGIIDDLYVAPVFRRCGAGRALLSVLFAACRQQGCAAVSVEVGESNAAALALYQQCGLAQSTDGRIWLSRTL
jgi:ribosomal protein S18 acetylase RimI-like enzyme